MTTSPICYMLMQTSVFVLFAIMLGVSYKHGLQWFITLIYGAGFGLFIEHAITEGKNPAYSYATDQFLCVGKAPIWVGLGWGLVAYACIRTALRMQFSHTALSDFVSRPAVAGFLAVGIDLTLDPIADALGFWTWHCDCLLKGYSSCRVPCDPKVPDEIPVLRYLGVPFDNFLGGWFGIIFTYSLSVFAISYLWRIIRKHPPEDAPHVIYRDDEEGLFAASAHLGVERLIFALVAPLLALAVSGGLFWKFVRPFAMAFYKQHLETGELLGCIVIFVIAGFVTAFASLLTRQTRRVDYGVLTIAIFFHLMPLLLLAIFGFPKKPDLYLTAPANLAFSILLFTWPFQRALVKTLRDRLPAWLRPNDGGDAVAGDLDEPAPIAAEE